MNTFKNILIAVLTGLLVLTFTTQSSNGATKVSPTAKAIQYDNCVAALTPTLSADFIATYDSNLKYCAKYMP